MKAFKSAQADVKETFQNIVAKVDETTALNKASASAKAARKEAENKAGKHDAKATYHAKQAEILRNYEQKKAANAAAKEQTKTILHQKKADKHTSKADQHATATGGIVGHGHDNVEQTTTAAAPSYIQEQADMAGRNAATPPSPDMSTTNPEDAALLDPVHHSQVPMHGSGVPTHSTLHSDSNPGTDTHDVRTTQIMNGSPNTGSYI